MNTDNMDLHNPELASRKKKATRKIDNKKHITKKVIKPKKLKK